MRVPDLVLLAGIGLQQFQTVPLFAQDPTVLANIDEAFRLAGVRNMLASLPSQVNEMTAAAVGQLPKDKREQFEPLLKDVSLKFLDPDAFYRELRAYFVKLYDAAHMDTFLALERTPVYRTMHRVEESADTPAAQTARRRFEANLSSEPPSTERVHVLQRLDEARNTTASQVRIVMGILKAMLAGMGTEMRADLESQSAALAEKIRPVLANKVLMANLYTYRNTDNADLEDYVVASQQGDIGWFNRNLQAAILAVVADRSSRAGEVIKTKAPQRFN